MTFPWLTPLITFLHFWSINIANKNKQHKNLLTWRMKPWEICSLMWTVCSATFVKFLKSLLWCSQLFFLWLQILCTPHMYVCMYVNRIQPAHPLAMWSVKHEVTYKISNIHPGPSAASLTVYHSNQDFWAGRSLTCWHNDIGTGVDNPDVCGTTNPPLNQCKENYGTISFHNDHDTLCITPLSS